MSNLPGILPSAAEYRRLEATYGLSSLEGVEFPAPGSSISSPPPPPPPEEVFQKYGCSLQMLTPNAVNKVVAFEMFCRANRYIPDYFIFNFFPILCYC
ncbi:unnamed protein product [Lactuca saligna]|uniref:Uncharacterized protein n=1 Tax=Lactuca saligna TaxID=75948 RepID=A0AA36E8A6_LACSI|nr:unnamed protein product [Lactuca saligna]